jgi:hypothetical protein
MVRVGDKRDQAHRVTPLGGVVAPLAPIDFGLFLGLGDWWPAPTTVLSTVGITVEVSSDGGSTWTPILTQCDEAGWTGINAVRLTVVQTDLGSGLVFFPGLDPFLLAAIGTDPSVNLFNGWIITAASTDSPAALTGVGHRIAAIGPGNNFYNCGAGNVSLLSQGDGAMLGTGVLNAPYTFTTVWEAHQ